MPVQNVGWLQAWSLWWQGVDVRPMALHGVPMLTVGRVGKIVSYLGGLTIIFDLIGATRVREIANRISGKSADDEELAWRFVWINGMATLMGCVCGFLMELMPQYRLILTMCAAFFLVVGLIGMAPTLVKMAAMALERERTERAFRWIGWIVFSIGFSFDLLAS